MNLNYNVAAIIEQIKKLRIVPVVAINDAADTVPLCEALIAGGIPCAEITFRTDAAADAIKTASAIPEMLVAAGTVVTLDQAKKALECGARFLVSPGFSPKIVEWCVGNKVLIIPGISTPTDLQMAVEFGLTTVKFFPAENYGGLKTLKALSAPFTRMQFMPTGGISAANICDYLAFEKVIACGGSWMVKSNLIAEKKFAEITRLCREAVTLIA